MPSGIGHGAVHVLRGCLEKSVSIRWTIDQVDDVAWGLDVDIVGNRLTLVQTKPP